MNMETSVQPSGRQWGLGFILVLAMALPMLILYACGALAPFILEEGMISREWLGSFTLAAFGVAAILSLYAGRWVKKSGIRLAGIALFLLTAGAFAALILAENLWLMIVAIAVCGIAQALANPMTNQAIATQVAPSGKSFMVGLKQSGVQLSALAAGSILPWIAMQWGWRMALGTVVPLCLVMAVVTACRDWQPKVTVAGMKPRAAAQPNTVGLLMWMQGCVGIVLAAFITQVPVFASQLGMPPAQAAFLVTLFGLMGWLSRLVLTPLASRMQQESDLLAWLFVVAALALVATFNAAPTTLWLIYAGVIGIGCTLVATNALAMSMILQHPCFGDIPGASGRVSFAFFGGLALGSLLFQWVVQAFGSTLAGMAMMLGLLSCSLLAVLRLRWSLSHQNYAPGHSS